jgi:hypothetical protein
MLSLADPTACEVKGTVTITLTHDPLAIMATLQSAATVSVKIDHTLAIVYMI